MNSQDAQSAIQDYLPTDTPELAAANAAVTLLFLTLPIPLLLDSSVVVRRLRDRDRIDVVPVRHEQSLKQLDMAGSSRSIGWHVASRYSSQWSPYRRFSSPTTART